MSVKSGSSLRQDHVLETIRQGILSGDLVPGQRLVETELADSTGASRGAVRAALIQLSQDGLVERIANRGARVRVVTLDEAIAITEVRMAIEALCVAKAAECITDQQIVDMRELGSRMSEAVATGDLIEYSRLNSTLHAMITRVADQPVAQEVLERLRARDVRRQFRLALRPGRPRTSLAQHLAIIDAVTDRDAIRAVRAMNEHLSDVIALLQEP